MKEIIIFGAGGHGHSVLELIRSDKGYQVKTFWDDQPSLRTILDVEVIKAPSTSESGTMCIAIGNNTQRKKVSDRYSKYIFPTFIHTSSVIYPSATIGKGTVVFPGAVIDASVEMGDFCIVNNQATISHNVRIGDNAHVAIQAAISGGVTIGEGALIGAGSVILPEISIGKWATIGAGAVVTKDVPDFATVIGNPAKIRS